MGQLESSADIASDLRFRAEGQAAYRVEVSGLEPPAPTLRT